MDKQSLIRKLDEGVNFWRESLLDNDGSTLKALASSTKQGFNALKKAFAHNEKAQKAMAEIKQQMEEMEKAVKKGDRKLSAKLLAAAEKKILKYKEKYGDNAASSAEKPAPQKPATGAAKKTPAKTAKTPAAKTKTPATAPAAKPAETKAPAKVPAAKPAETKAPAKAPAVKSDKTNASAKAPASGARKGAAVKKA